MGKYNDLLKREDRNKERLLGYIANELAEANRLKRFELQNGRVWSDGEDEELKDKA